MKRTSLWIYVAGVAVQLAALGLCAWAMERWLGSDARAEAEAEAGAPAAPPPAAAPAAAPSGAQVHVPAPQAGAALFDVAAEDAARVSPLWSAPPAPAPPPPAPPPPAPPPPAPAPAPQPPPAREAHVPPSPPAHFAPSVAAPPVSEPPPVPRPAPLFGPPPAHAERPAAAVPPFVFEGGDDGTQVLHGQIGERSLVIGIGSDGSVRCVDVDGGRYSGQSESARARLREVDGSRAFTVQLGIDGAGALHASFTGGGHDGETIALSPLVEGSAS
jgi:hypothetical protein